MDTNSSLLRLYLLVVAVVISPANTYADETTTMQTVETESTSSQPAATEPMATQLATEPAVTAALPAVAAPLPVIEAHSKPSPWFYGATFGAGFGDVRYTEISPMIGRTIGDRISVGASYTYRYRNDTRFQEDLSTSDYGTTVFARLNVLTRVYLQAEYEYLDYEYINSRNTTARDNFDSVLAGIGMSSPMGRRSSMYFTAMYNFNYDDENSPYTEAVSVRIGVGTGF